MRKQQTTNDNITELLYFQGIFSFTVVSDLISKIEDVLTKMSVEKIQYKRILSTSVELLENIKMHSLIADETQQPIFRISHTNGSFKIESCNTLLTEDLHKLVEKIEHLNKNSPDLSEIFNMNLSNKALSEKGGAGLGLYIIRRNSLDGIYYDYKQISDKFCFFCISVFV